MVLDQQAHQKLIHDKHARGREFEVGQKVMVQILLNGPKFGFRSDFRMEGR